MCHERLAVVLLLAFVVSAAVLVPPPATVFRMTVASAAQDPSAVEAALGLDRPTRWLIQQGLRKEGFDAGEPDGLFGPRTREAVRRWQAARGMPTTGYLDGLQAELLRVAGEPRPAESEVAATDVPPVAESPAAPPAATESPAPVQAVSCEDWNTQEFFEMATAEDVTGLPRRRSRRGSARRRRHHTAALGRLDQQRPGRGRRPSCRRRRPRSAERQRQYPPAQCGGERIWPLEAPCTQRSAALHQNNENPAVLEALLAAGADVTARNDIETTPP